MANIITTRNWLVALGNTNVTIATALINQGILLDDLHEVEPEDVKKNYQTTHRLGGEIHNGDPNSGLNVPAMLQLKLTSTVQAAQYYDTMWCPIKALVIPWAYIKQFKGALGIHLSAHEHAHLYKKLFI